MPRGTLEYETNCKQRGAGRDHTTVYDDDRSGTPGFSLRANRRCRCGRFSSTRVRQRLRSPRRLFLALVLLGCRPVQQVPQAVVIRGHRFILGRRLLSGRVGESARTPALSVEREPLLGSYGRRRGRRRRRRRCLRCGPGRFDSRLHLCRGWGRRHGRQLRRPAQQDVRRGAFPSCVCWEGASSIGGGAGIGRSRGKRKQGLHAHAGCRLSSARPSALLSESAAFASPPPCGCADGGLRERDVRPVSCAATRTRYRLEHANHRPQPAHVRRTALPPRPRGVA
jgi:hypothetical protein